MSEAGEGTIVSNDDFGQLIPFNGYGHELQYHSWIPMPLADKDLINIFAL